MLNKGFIIFILSFFFHDIHINRSVKMSFPKGFIIPQANCRAAELFLVAQRGGLIFDVYLFLRQGEPTF